MAEYVAHDCGFEGIVDELVHAHRQVRYCPHCGEALDE